MIVDINGDEVVIGSVVKVLRIDPGIYTHLSEGEVNDVASMLGGEFKVYDIDEYGCAWVEKWWDCDDGGGGSYCHCLSMMASDMLLIR